VPMEELKSSMTEIVDELEKVANTSFFKNKSDVRAELIKIIKFYREGREETLRDGMKALFQEIDYSDTRYKASWARLKDLDTYLKKFYSIKRSDAENRLIKFKFKFNKTAKKKNEPRDCRIFIEPNRHYDNPANAAEKSKFATQNKKNTKIDLSTPIVVVEQIRLKWKYRPRLIKIISHLAWFLTVLTFSVSIIIIAAEFIRRNQAMHWVGIFLFIGSIFIWGPISLAFKRLSYDKFSSLHLRKFFIRISEHNNIVLASYAGSCPLCDRPSKLELLTNFCHFWISNNCNYAQCEIYPGHRFPFDRVKIIEAEEQTEITPPTPAQAAPPAAKL
jgi:hypothetical protein